MSDVNIGNIVATLKINDQLSPGVKNATQVSAAEIGRMQAAVQAAQLEVRQLTKAIGDMGIAAAQKNGLDVELGKATIKATELSAQLSATKAAIRETAVAQNEVTAATSTATSAGGEFGEMVTRITERLLVYASIRGVLGAVESTVQYGLQIERLSQQTGMGTAAIQRFTFASTETAVPLNNITTAITQMQRKLELEDGGLIRGLTTLGIRWETLRSMAPEDQFDLIAQKLGAVKDQTEFAGLASEIFNSRSGASIAAVIRQWDELKDKAHDVNVILSNEEVDALAKVARGWDEVILRAKVYFAQTIVKKVQFDNPDPSQFESNAQAGFDVTFTQLPEMLDGVVKPAEGAAHALSDLFQVEKLFTGMSFGLDKQGIANLAIADEEAKRLTQSAKELAAANKIVAEAWADYTTAGRSWVDVMNALGASTYEGIAYDHARGVSTSALATVYGVYKGQVDEVIKSEKTYTETLKELAKVEGTITQPGDTLKLGGLEHMGGVIPEKFFADTAKAIERMQDIERRSDEVSTKLEHIGIVVKPSAQEMVDSLSRGDQAVIAIAEDFKRLPDLMIMAFTGGGNLTGALQGFATQISNSLFGNNGPFKNITQQLSATIQGSLSGVLGKGISSVLGSTISSILPGLGGLVAPVISWIGGLFHHGPTAAEIAAQKAWNAELRTNVSLFDQLATAADKAQALKFGMADWAKQNIIVTEAYVALGRTGEEALADITAALNLQGQAQQDAITRINLATQAWQDQMAAQKQAAADLEAAESRYGFNQQQRGAQLLIAYDALVGKGYDVSTVTKQMSADIEAYFLAAQKVGADIPPDMVPMLQLMMTMGLLTDAAGNKITSFGAAIVNVMNGVAVPALSLVSDKITQVTNDLEKALAKTTVGPVNLTTTTVDGVTVTNPHQQTYTADEAVQLLQHVASLYAPNNPANRFGGPLGDTAIQQIAARFGYTGGTILKSQFDAFLTDLTKQFVAGTFNVNAQAGGGDYLVTRPTLFLAGEAGIERASFSGAGRTSLPGGMGGNDALLAEMKANTAATHAMRHDLARRIPRLVEAAVKTIAASQ